MGCFCNLLKENDMFGKQAILYFDKENQKSSIIGIIFTLLYYTLYILFFLFKLKRMYNHLDVMSYDTFTYISRNPSIKLSNDNFYGGFALENPRNYNSFLDKTIYEAKAYFIEAVRNETEWKRKREEEIQLEKCSIHKFGEKFQNIFKNNSLDYLYCFNTMNETLKGHFSYNHYTYFFIQLFPCKNTTENNNHCKPREELDLYLNSTFFSMEFEDVELAPNNYKEPVSQRNQDIYFKVGKKFFQEVHIYYQILEIETDEEKYGLEINEQEDLRKEQFLKYHSIYQMPSLLEEDIYDTGQPFCNITIKLFDQIRTQRRTYSKLFSIWGDVGGLMEFVKIIFNVLTAMIIDLLYEIEIVNKLFFPLKEIAYKESKTLRKRKAPVQINNYLISFFKLNSIKKQLSLKSDSNKKLNKRLDINLAIESRNINILNVDGITSKEVIKNENQKEKGSIKIKNLEEDEILKNTRNPKDNKIYEELENHKEVENPKEVGKIKEGNKSNNSKIKLESKNVKKNYFFIYFLPCFYKLRKKDDTIFHKKAMELFTKKMDIFNIYKIVSKAKDVLYEKESIYI